MAKKSRSKTAYLPTVGGQPARFCDNYQLCIGGGLFYVEPVADYRTVKRQIAASIRNRLRDGLSADASEYGYVRIRIKS